jgi:hypothetical protein
VDDAAETFFAAFERGHLPSASSSTTRMACELASAPRKVAAKPCSSG